MALLWVFLEVPGGQGCGSSVSCFVWLQYMSGVFRCKTFQEEEVVAFVVAVS